MHAGLPEVALSSAREGHRRARSAVPVADVCLFCAARAGAGRKIVSVAAGGICEHCARIGKAILRQGRPSPHFTRLTRTKDCVGCGAMSTEPALARNGVAICAECLALAVGMVDGRR